MNNHILFVFEGEKAEKQIATSLQKYFLHENTIVHCVYCNDIYELHKVISMDEDLDTFMLLKEIPRNTRALSSYSRNDFAEIYMFFDYDGHDNLASDDKVMDLLQFFNEETAYGKLLLNYPMVEALKHIPENEEAFKILKISAKENIRYKQLVDSEAQKELKQITKYSEVIWLKLIDLHLKKLNFLMTENYMLPKLTVTQNSIFLSQLEKYLNVDATVAVLSAFPVFVFDYYGYQKIERLLSLET